MSRKWTWSSGKEKSIIDYIMMGVEYKNGVKSIIIDEKNVPISNEGKWWNNS